jgi:peptide-methionine (R)-S-oxide reductase
MNFEEKINQLSLEEKHVLFEGGTEKPFSGALLDEHRDGTFMCKVCHTPLFASGAKFDSGTGWPSFDQAIPGALSYHEDTSLGMIRTEVTCASCHAHLGHVFPDGPTKTGERYCMNSICLTFKENEIKEGGDL